MKQIKFQDAKVSKAVVDKILIEKGQRVNANEVLATILTRDKTINICAPGKCLISKILISSSDIVENDEILFEIEEIVDNNKKVHKDDDISSRLLAREQALENRRNGKAHDGNTSTGQAREQLLAKLAEREKNLEHLDDTAQTIESNKEEKNKGKKTFTKIEEEIPQTKVTIAKKQKSMLSSNYDNYNIVKEGTLDQVLLTNFISNLGITNAKKTINNILSEKKNNSLQESKAIKLPAILANLPITWNFVSVKVDISELINLLTLVKTKHSKILDLKVMPFYLLAVNKALKSFPYFNSFINENGLSFNWQINLATELLFNDAKLDVVFKNINDLSSRELILEVDNSLEKPEAYKNDLENNNVLKVLTYNSLQFNEAFLVPQSSMLSQITFGTIQKEPLVSTTGQEIIIHETMTISLASRTMFFSNELVSKFINYLAFLISKPALLM